jgi:WD40 repeat protein
VSRCDLCLTLVLMAALTVSSSLAEHGIPTSKSIDEITAEIENALDFGNPNIEQTAVTIAKDYPGEYNINQVSEIYDTLVIGWYYFSDPSYSEKYKNANLTLQDGKTSSSVGMGDCDDFAILMSSLINSLGGSTRITLASNSSSTEGHAYCELFLGYENDSQVNDLINWTKAQYGMEEVPGLSRTGNEVWMNLDWWAMNLGGPYFEGDIGRVVWQSDKLISPKIVPIIDTMDSTAGWAVVRDNLGSNATISLAPARKGRGSAINITYDLKEGGWAGISKKVDPEVLSLINGLNVSYSGMSKQNTLELRLVDDNETEFETSWKPAIQAGNWKYLQDLFENFECLGPNEKCSAEGDVLNLSEVKKLEMIISDRPKEGDAAGHGKVDVDHIVGVMNVPPGSPWARAEAERQMVIAKDLASQSALILSNKAKLIQSIKLGVESLSDHETFEGDLALRHSLNLLPRCIAELSHDSKVFAAAFSPDETKLVTSVSNATCIWDVHSGQVLEKHPYDCDIKSAIFSPNGKKIAGLCDDKIVMIWEVQNGNKLQTLMHNASVRIMDFSFNGNKLATICDDNIAYIWDVESGTQLQKLEFNYTVNDLTFSPDGTKLATGGSDRTASLWDVQNGRILHGLEHEGEVYKVVFSPDGTKLATGSSDQTARLWNVLTGMELHKLPHKSGVYELAFSPDGNMLAVCDGGQTAYIWDANRGRLLQELKDDDYLGSEGGIVMGGEDIISLLFSPDGTRLVTLSKGNPCGIWDIQTGRKIQLIGGANWIMFSPNGTNLATSNGDKIIRLWDLRQVPQELRHNGRFTAVSFSPDGSKLATASNNTARIWDLRKGKELHIIEHDKRGDVYSSVDDVAFSPDGKVIAMGGIDNTSLIDVDSGKELRRLETGHNVAFSQDGTKLATGSLIWDLPKGEKVQELKIDEWVNDVAFSPEGQKIATASGQKAQLWDVQTGRALQKLQHNGSVEAVSFSPEGNELATASWDGLARIWDLETGREIQRFRHDSFVYSVAFSPDGRTLATASYDETARLWDASTGLELKRLENDGAVYTVAFSPDGMKLATGSSDGKARIWIISSQDLVCEACNRLGYNLTSQEWRDQYCSKCTKSSAYPMG